jgi:hypothetical protein
MISFWISVVPPKIHASRDLLTDLLLFSLVWARCAARRATSPVPTQRAAARSARNPTC